MKQFHKKLILFFIALITVIFIGIMLPSTPRSSTSLLFASKKKDSLLEKTLGPRIIFIGGSNTSFGINSAMIKDSLNLFPINTGIHASLGLQYMLKSTIRYVRPGDLVVLIPEYALLEWDYHKTSEELLRSVVEVAPTKISLLSTEQLLDIFKYIPNYALSKFNPFEYVLVKEDQVYSVNSFNQFGDVYKHWALPPTNFNPDPPTTDPVNERALQEILSFKDEVKKKKAILLVSFPSYHDASFDTNKNFIDKVYQLYRSNQLTILGTPERYKMSGSLMFNSVYHLTKKGVDLRTKMLIQDIRPYLNKFRSAR